MFITDDKTVNDFALSKGCTEIYIVSKNNTNSSGKLLSLIVDIKEANENKRMIKK